MKRVYILLVCVIMLTAVLTSCKRQPALPLRTESELELSHEFLTSLVKKDYSHAANMFSADVKAQLPANKLEDAWKSHNLQLGNYRDSAEPVSEVQPPYFVVITPMEFDSGTIKLRLVFNAQKQIAGIFFIEPQIISRYEQPAYIDPSKFSEREVVIGSGEWSLPGTLSVPNGAGPFPAVVLVHGSGPNDRDETILHNKPFRDLAQGLASQGIAVLRYDKRTLVHAAKLNAATVTPQNEVVEDAVLAAQLLMNQPEIKSSEVYILGHSLGGFLTPRILETLPQARGGIVLAGPSRPLEDLVIEQFSYLYNQDGDLTSIEKQHLKELEAQVQRVKNLKPSSNTAANLLPLGLPAPYWLYLRDYDPVTAANNLPHPLLVLQGERDYQVTMQDFSRWQQVTRQSVTTKSYSQLNHLFISGNGSGLSTPEEYSIPSHVEQQVIIDIAAWINGN